MKACLHEVCQTKWKLWRTLLTPLSVRCGRTKLYVQVVKFIASLATYRNENAQLFFNDKRSSGYFNHHLPFRLCQFPNVSSAFFCSVTCDSVSLISFQLNKLVYARFACKQKQLKINANTNTHEAQPNRLLHLPTRHYSPKILFALIHQNELVLKLAL